MSGLRNPQGLAWHPDTGDAFVSEHGPSELSWESYGGWFGDEVNAIVENGNYGWPEVAGTGGPDQFIDPLVEWSPSVGPAGLAVYSGPYERWHGNLMVANLRGERLWRIVLEQRGGRTGWQMVMQEPLLQAMVGRIRVVAMGLDGHLYIATSNRDSRGKPGLGDDQIYRVVPGS